MSNKHSIFLDIKNEYNDYAKCMKIMRDLLYESSTKINDFLDINITINEYKESRINPNKLEEPIDGKNMSSSISEVPYETWCVDPNKYILNAHFHIRIHFDPDTTEINLENLHYLSLLLIYFDDLIINNRLSVFLVPRSGDKYPFNQDKEIDTELYELSSIHLRALIGSGKQGVIYGVPKGASEENSNIVKALNFKITKPVSTFFPVIVLTNSSSNDIDLIKRYFEGTKVKGKSKDELSFSKDEISKLNHYYLLFNDGVTGLYFYEALKLTSHHRFGFANDNSPRLALADYVFETAFKNLKNKFEEKHLDIIDYFGKNNSYLNSFKKFSIFTFSIFAFLFTLPNNLEKSEIIYNINEYCKLSVELSDALNQLVQNSLQHSSRHICSISFIKESVGGENLKIIISDLGQKNILETFTETIQSEKNTLEKLINLDDYFNKLNSTKNEIIKANSEVLKYKQELKLKHFFNDFSGSSENIISMWHAFRQSDSSAHIGLALFSHIMNKCNALFSVSSNGNFKHIKNNYYRNKYEYPERVKSFVIPGTEYNISVPIQPLSGYDSSGISQLSYGNYCENYDCYAKFLDFSISNFYVDNSIIDHIKQNYINASKLLRTNSLNKFSQQFIWTYFWLEILNHQYSQENQNIIYNIDFSKIQFRRGYLETALRREVVIKGFINAIGVFAEVHKNEDLYIAFTNLNNEIMKTFKDVVVSLSIKRFPQNLQMFVSNNSSDIADVQIHLFGSTYSIAIQNAYILSIENGIKSFNNRTYHAVHELTVPFHKLVNITNTKSVKLIPFSMFLHGLKNKEICMFFENVSVIANNELTNGKGYKIHSTHTRLGNKVHIDMFYEMSFLFYRTIMANRVAFEIIRSIRQKGINIIKDNILFYGYASYSQAILMSLTNILKTYRSKNSECGRVLYAVYQYNLQSESKANEIQIYLNKNELVEEEYKVIQIVPISSTLTTFEKMWLKFNSEYNGNNKSGATFELFHNHTIIWIRDDVDKKRKEYITGNHDESIDKFQLTKIEEKYYNKPQANTVETKFEGLGKCKSVSYIIIGYAYWENPEECSKCFPDNVLDEVPLIETDLTSTVPSQQIYLKPENNLLLSVDENNLNHLSYKIIENLERISALRSNVYYGHFKRGKNHFQYYINTHAYFAQIESKVKDWLEKLSLNQSDYLDDSIIPSLNVIFSPEHNTNVGFSQYVNAYYFKGTAEVISINEDKEFRSNFICEHAALKNTISRLLDDFSYGVENNHCPVKFYFVDDNIITGSTYRKANSLLQSLIPEKYMSFYKTCVFEKCFFLIDRLSQKSKTAYVYPIEKFYSFCHIDISNIRKHGDSCIGCKLLSDTEKLFKKSSTRYSADYWSKKVSDYKPISFENIKDIDTKRSYIKLVLSHILNNLFNMNYYHNDEVYFEMIVNVFDYFADKENERVAQKYDSFIREHEEKCFKTYKDITKKEIIECLIRIISRPFFTFNHGIKKQVLKFMIYLSENILRVKNLKGIKEIDNTIEKIIKLYGNKFSDSLVLLRDYVFRAFVDLHSTYLMRKSTILSVLDFCMKLSAAEKLDDQGIINLSSGEVIEYNELIESFWLQYSVFVQKTVNSSYDETRSLRLERLLLSGSELFKISNNSKFKLFSDLIISENYKVLDDKVLESAFKTFCSEIFLANGHVLFKRLKQISYNNNLNYNIYDSYFLERWKQFREVDYYWLNIQNRTDVIGEKELFKNLNPKNNKCHLDSINKELEGQNFNIEKRNTTTGHAFIRERYDTLLNNIRKMIVEKYSVNKSKSVHLAILTGSDMNESNIIHLHDLEMISDTIEISKDTDDAYEKYTIKKRIFDVLNSDIEAVALKKYGYHFPYAFDNNSEMYNLNKKSEYESENSNIINPYFILRFDISENMTNSHNELKPIVPVYMYISVKSDEKNENYILPWLIMRDILTYRYQIIKYLVADFTSDVLQRYAHSMGTETILKTDKAISHSPINDDLNQLKQFNLDKVNTINEKLKPEILFKWVISRNYCNNMTARLYNRVLRNINKSLEMVIMETENPSIRKAIKLYVEYGVFDGNSNPIQNIADILPSQVDKDPIFSLFKDIIYFETDKRLNDKKAISVSSKEKFYTYNLAYTKNIIYRICLDALRFSVGAGAEYDDFIKRIIHHYDFMKKRQIYQNSDKSSIANKLLAPYNIVPCEVTFNFEKSDNDDFDWLVIRNRIDRNRNDNINRIRQRLYDPLDFTDGNMSLLAEKEYMTKLFDSSNPCALSRETYIIDNMFKYNNNYFETRLPLLEKEN